MGTIQYFEQKDEEDLEGIPGTQSSSGKFWLHWVCMRIRENIVYRKNCSTVIQIIQT